MNVKAFSLMEIVAVLVIIAVLAAIAIPMMHARIDSGKWSEANATAGIIQRAVRVYFSETGDKNVCTTLEDPSTQVKLGLHPEDLSGVFFVAGDYRIADITPTGIATVVVTGSQSNAPTGSKTLASSGTWH